MPHAITHFLIPIVLLSLFRDFVIKDKKSFPIHYIFVGGLAGLLPDIDIAVYYFLSFFGFTLQEVHRTFSHSLFVPFFFILLAGISYNFKNRELGKHHLKLKNIFIVITFGIIVHLILDAVIEGQIMPFYPLLNYSIGLNLINFAPNAWQDTLMPTLDVVLLILWMIYLEVKHKVSDFI